MVRVMAGELASDELPMVAADALVEGQDTPALRQRAGLSRSEGREARDLLAQVLDDLGLPSRRTRSGRIWEMARWYAELILSGAIEPIAGAHAIAWHAGSLVFPKTFATFAYLADLWQDRAFERVQLERAIIQEARHMLTLEQPQPHRPDQEVRDSMGLPKRRLTIS
jgi:hypothetical protein